MDPSVSRLPLHRVAVHVLARARVEASGRFSLRPSAGGFSTPDLAPDGRRIRVSGTHLVVESDMAGAPSARSTAIGGHSLAELTAFAGVDLNGTLDVGHDTPPVGATDEPITLDTTDALDVNRWFGVVAAILDEVLAQLPASVGATLPRLWPEHFDVAIEADAHPDRRVNLGGSPGDGFNEGPYLYVGPWTADRPGDAGFWNASFGGFRTRDELASDGDDLVAAGVAFLLDGFRRLR